jgi:hypothetical protein
MSTPASSTPAASTAAAPTRVARPYSLFQERLVVTLLPYFLPLASNFQRARAEVVDTLESYGARTRAEMVNAARIIALSFGALDLLAEARAGEMPYTTRLRACGYANSLDRSCQQEEKALAKRLAADPPQAQQPSADPIDDLPEAEVEAAFEQARAQIEDYRTRLAAGDRHAIPASTRDSNDLSWSGTMISAAAHSGMPATPTR